MPKHALRRHLDQLRRELDAQEKLDPQTRALLEKVAADVENVIDDDAETPSSPGDRIEAAALEFEAEHPGLARILREVGDTLAKLGV